MNDLLSLALAAHGGIARWSCFTDVEATVSVTGGLWSIKQRTDLFDPISIFAATRDQGLILQPFSAPDRLAFFEPECVTIETLEERVVSCCEHPLAEFADHTVDTPWDHAHAAWFLGHAVWAYLTAPFLYTYPGFATEELSPHEENGEAWRRLKIVFPNCLARHSRTQIAYFGPDGLLRRHDSTIDVLGSLSSTDYASDYREFNGIKIPTRRRLYGVASDGRIIVPAPLLAIDFDTLAFR
jgi:hypothetical protein